jgi:SsrA-binding protein
MSHSEEVEKPLVTNRQARHRYHILERFEAGIALEGSEVKSVREGRANLRDAYARVRRGEAFLFNCHISPYAQAGPFAPNPTRERKLLLHRREILRLQAATDRSGHTLVPLRLYLKRRRVKVEIAVARAKKMYDKREAKRRETIDREAAQAVKAARQRR